MGAEIGALFVNTTKLDSILSPSMHKIHVTHLPTSFLSFPPPLKNRFNVETLQYKNIKFQVWDLGGQTSIRPYWRCYYPNTDAIIFVVDSADVDRLAIAKQELNAMLEEEELRDSILLVFANKQDQKGALNASQVKSLCGRNGTYIHTFHFQRQMVTNTHTLNISTYIHPQISEALGLSSLRNRQWSIQETSATKGKGLFEGFDWLVTCITGGANAS